MNELSIIDRFTETFSRYIDSGFGLLSGDVAFLTTILIGIDITLAGLFWALHGEDNVIAQLIRKVLYVGFFALLLNNFKSLADIVFNSFAGLGLKATGVSMTAADLMRPGFVASTGFTASRPMLEKAGELIGITSFFTNFVTIVVLMLAWLIVLLAFFVLAVQLFIAILEFKLTALAGFVLVPFALFGATAFLAERVLGNVISSGIKLMVLAIIVGIGSTLFGATLTPPGNEITLAQASSTILAAIAVFGLAIFVPGVAAGLVSGAPQLGAGAAVATTAAVGGTAIAGGMLATGGARLAGRVGGGAVKAGASLTGTVGAAYQAGGMRGVARATIAAPASSTAGAITAPVRDAYREGAAAGYRANAPASDPGSGPPPPPAPPSASAAPPWAQHLARRQQLTHAGLVAGHAIREGDRPSGGQGPDLKGKG